MVGRLHELWKSGVGIVSYAAEEEAVVRIIGQQTGSVPGQRPGTALITSIKIFSVLPIRSSRRETMPRARMPIISLSSPAQSIRFCAKRRFSTKKPPSAVASARATKSLRNSALPMTRSLVSGDSCKLTRCGARSADEASSPSTSWPANSCGR